MIQRQAFQFKLMPNGEQRGAMRRFAGSCRYVFNRGVALQKERYANGEKRLSYAGLCKELTQWRREDATAWLADTHSQALQQALKDVDRAYVNFFEQRAAFPRFKRKGQSDSFRYPQGSRLEQGNGRIFLPKIGWVRYRKSRDIVGTVKNVTITSRHGAWFVAIQTEREIETPTHPSTSMIGIDMGIARFATLSDGTDYPPLSAFKRHENALAQAQRAMARKQRFSHNWKKAKARVQTIHARIGNARRDYLHQLSHTISKNHAMVCIEDLRVRNMSASATGTVDAPGKRVRAKSGLNKAILDQGWGEFRRQLEYKLTWRGGELLPVPPQNTSRTCPQCGHIAKENRRSQARFCCVQCDYENHADVVGAINVLRAGHARLACADTSSVGKDVGPRTHRSDLDDGRLSAVGIPVL